MDHYAENLKLAKSLGHSFQYRDIKVGWLGKIDAAGVVNPDPMDGLALGYVWVRFEENGEAVRVINLKVSGRMPNVRVHVGRALNGELTVIGLAEENIAELGDLTPTLNIPDRIADVIMELLDTNRIKPLRVNPGTTAFDVDIAPGFYWYNGVFKAWAGGTINIAASVPGGFNTKRPVLIGIDLTTDTLVSYDGDVIFMTVPPLRGKMFTEVVIAQTVVDAAMPDVFWIACVPITVNDTTWNDPFRVTALQFTNGSGAATTSGKVLVSSADTTPDYLSVKLQEGTGIDLTILNPAADEKIFIEVDESELSLANLGSRALDDLSDVAIVAPTANDQLYHNGSNWLNGKISVLKTGDTMTGSLTIASSADPSLFVTGTYTAPGSDASLHAGVLSTLGINQNTFNLTAVLGGAGLRGITAVVGASGTVTGVAGVAGLVTKSGAGTLTNAYSLFADTITKSAGTLDNAIGVYIAAQNTGTNNYGLYQGGAGLNLLNDQLGIVGSADRIDLIVKAHGTKTTAIQEWQANGGGVLASIGKNGALTISQAATTGTPSASATITAAAHTALTASTEFTEINFNLSATQQFATGALTTQRALRIQAPTYSAVGSSTITTAVTVDISGAPINGTNVTITNKIGLRVGDRLQINGTLDIVPPASTGTPQKPILLTAPAHTALTATEQHDIHLNLARNVQFTTGGSMANQRAIYIDRPTYTATSATQTIVDATTVYLVGPPVASTNVSITNSRTLWVASGVTRLDGQLQMNELVVMGEARNFQFGSTTGTKIGTGTSQKIALWDKTPIVRPTALTTALTTVTFTAPGATDYSMTDPLVGGLGFANLNEARTLFSVIANLQTRVNELESRLSSFGFLP